MATKHYTIPDFGPSDLLTSDVIGERRVKVELPTGGGGLTDTELRASAVDIADAGEREYSHVAQLVTATGDTVILTPAAGKSIRLWWVYALNDPSSLTPRLITIKIGASTYFVTYGVSKRQKVTGGINDSLVVNLNGGGSVAFTAIYEEI